jgi:hypothetical protein
MLALDYAKDTFYKAVFTVIAVPMVFVFPSLEDPAPVWRQAWNLVKEVWCGR